MYLISAAFLGAWLALLLGYYLINKLYLAYFTPLSRLPGPFVASLTNKRLKAAVMTGKRTDYIHELHLEYGPIVRISPDEVAIADISAQKEIHRVGSPYLKSKWYQALRTGGPDAPMSFFNMDDPKDHAARRKLFARGFTRENLRERWESHVLDRVNLAVWQIRRESHSNGSADILKWWILMASDIAAKLMFGEDFGTLDTGETAEYVKAIEKAGIAAALLAEFPPLYWLGSRLPFQKFKTIFQSHYIILEQGKLAVANSRANASSTNIFGNILAESEKGDATLTDLDIAVEAGGLMLAASDTVSGSLTYLCWAIMSQPETQAALEEEVNAVDGHLSDSKLENLPILNACIDESLRLYCAVSASLPRIVPCGGATLVGHYLPAGTTVSTQAWTLHRDPAIFPEPEKFDYHRWLHPRQLPVDKQAAYFPFGGGSRVCMGQHLARMELRLATATLFRECRGVKLAPTTTKESMQIENYFLITPVSHKCEVVV